MPTSARSMGTNFSSGMARAASRERTITHRSPGPACTTSAATCRPPTGSSFLFNGWTTSSFNPSVPGYLIVQIAVPRTLPNNIIYSLDNVRATHQNDHRRFLYTQGGSPLQKSSFQSYAFDHA